MSDIIKDGVGLEPTTTQPSGVEQDLARSMKFYQDGDREAALRTIRPWADQGEVRACLLAARLYKDGGDAVRCRNYLYTAVEQGDGDAALMLAQEYMSEDPVVALEWAEKAHARKIPGAGRLLLRLATAKGSWKEAVRMAAEELAWLEDDQAEALFVELDTVLDGDYLDEQEILKVLEPVEQSLPKGSKGQTLLSGPCERLRQKFKDQQAREKKAKRQAKVRRAGHQAAQTTTSAVGALKNPFLVFLAAAAAFGLNIIAHGMAGTSNYFATLAWGFLNCYLCNRVTVTVRTAMEGNLRHVDLSQLLIEGLGMFWLKLVAWIVPCAVLGYLLCWADPLRAFFGSPEIGAMRIGTILLAFVEGLYGAFSDDFGF